MTDFSHDAPVTAGEDDNTSTGYGLFQNSANHDDAPYDGPGALPAGGLYQSPSTVDTDGPDHDAWSIGELSLKQDMEYLQAQVNDQGRMIADLHAKVDHLAQGIGMVYTMVDHLVKMLSAVQQVASMMPGGKRIAQAMQAQQQNGGQQ